MKKLYALLATIILMTGCVKEYDKHHITLNDTKGVDTQFFPKDRRLKISNKPYVLFFFDARCGVCKAIIPSLNEIYKDFGNKIDVIGILGGSTGFDDDIKLLKAHDIKFKTISDKVSVNYFSKAVGGVMGVPVVYIFNENGDMKDKSIGLTPKNILIKQIKEVL